MKHIIYLDPLEELNVRKDSSLLLALTLKEKYPTYLLFERDLMWENTTKKELNVFLFEGELEDDGCYIKNFKLTESSFLKVSEGDFLHMRLDPPVDGRYLRFLWILDQWEREGVKVINCPRGIMQFNEKLYAYQQKESVPSFVGENIRQAMRFIEMLKNKGHKELILKPLDLFSGIGVEKLSLEEAPKRFPEKAKELDGAIVIQPFMEEIKDGELRSLFFKSNHLGTILKKPKEGEFLSNIAQGASFSAVEISRDLEKKCQKICDELQDFGVYWVAFDILGETITEVNITCPGLLVEVSYAKKENLAKKIIEYLE